MVDMLAHLISHSLPGPIRMPQDLFPHNGKNLTVLKGV